MKQCSTCKEWKFEGDFHKNKYGAGGINSVCKTCKLETISKWRDTNKDKVREMGRKQSKKNYAQNKEKILADAHERYENSAVKKLRDFLRKIKVPKPKIQWRHENPEKISEYNHQYYLGNKDKFSAKVQNRRAKYNGGDITAEQWRELKEKYNYTCLRCKRREPEITLTRDHVLPLNLGGLHVIENIQPLCKSCNSWKHTKHIDYR